MIPSRPAASGDRQRPHSPHRFLHRFLLPARLWRRLCPLFLLPLALQSPLSAQYSTPLSKIVRNKDGSKLTVQVDPTNQRVEENFFDKNGALVWKLVRELDDDCQPMRAIKFDARDQIISRHRYICLRGRVEEEEILDAKNNLRARLVYHYEAKGRMTRIDHYNAAGKLVSTSRSSGTPVDPILQDTGSPNAPTGTPPR
jgi:hypothetical protein